MTDTISLSGLVGTTPRHLITGAGLAITSFRLASTVRRFDRAKNSWVDGDTNWYTVTTFRQLAFNTAASIEKGERVVVVGRMRVRDWQNGDKSGTNVEIEADAVGHDLSWGTTKWSRTVVASTAGGSSASGAQPIPEGFPESHDPEGASVPATPISITEAASFDDLLVGESPAREAVPF
jgi:single-strand DNA-binding protein